MSDMENVIRTIETNFRLGILSNRQLAYELRSEMGQFGNEMRTLLQGLEDRMDEKLQNTSDEHDRRTEETLEAIKSVLELRVEEKRKMAEDSKRIEELENRVKALEDKQAS